MSIGGTKYRAFVGRDFELAILSRGLKSALEGSGGLFLVSGGPGSGKTRLINEFAHRATSERLRVLGGWGEERSLARLLSHLQPDAGDLFVGGPAIQSVGFRANGGELAPGDANVPGPTPLAEDREKLPLFRRVRDVLADAAKVHPLLLLLDDIHDADEQSLAALRSLAPALCTMPVILVASFRSSAQRRDLFRRTIEAMNAVCCQLELSGLSEGCTGELLRSLIGEDPDPVVLGAFQKATGGNPLLVHHLSERSKGGVLLSPGLSLTEIPIGARLAAESWLRDLSPGAQEVAGCASMLGHDFDDAFLARVVDSRPDAAFNALEELRQSGLIARSGSCAAFRFVHGLVRRLCYERMPSTVAKRCRERILAVLETNSSSDHGTDCPDFFQSVIGSPDPNLAALARNHALRAARHAAESGRLSAAERICTSTIAAIEPAADEHDLAPPLLLELASAQTRLGRTAEAEVTLRRAAAVAELHGDTTALAEVALELPSFVSPAPGLPNAFAAMISERVLIASEQLDGDRRAMLLGRLAAESFHVPGDHRRAREMISEALKSVSDGTDLTTRLYVLRHRDCLLQDPDLIEDRLANADEITTLARRCGDYGALCESALNQAASALELCRAAEAAASGEVLLCAASMSRDPLHRGSSLLYQAARAAMEGRLDHAEQSVNACRAIAEHHRILHLRDLSWPCLVKGFMEQDRLAEIEPIALETARRRVNQPWWTLLISWIRLKQGQEQEARFDYERLAERSLDDLRNCGQFLATSALLSELSCLMDDRAAAQRLYEGLLPYRDRLAVLGSAAVLGSVSRYLGLLASKLGRIEEALDYFERAMARNRAVGCGPEFAYAAYDLAATLARAGVSHRARARELAQRAEVEAASLGMKRLAGEAADLHSRLQSKAPEDGEEIWRGAGAATTRIRQDGFLADLGNTSRGNSGATLLPAGIGDLSAEKGNDEVNSINGGANRGGDVDMETSFRREGVKWRLAYAGKVVSAKHLKGFSLIAQLLSHPGERFHASELARVCEKNVQGADGTGAIEISETGPVLDSRAKADYYQRIKDLRLELEDADAANDLGRMAKAEEELAFLTRELARAVGLYERDRRTGSLTERSRVRVTNAIRSAIVHISERHPSLGAYLNRTIKTGTYCYYLPDPSDRASWQL